MSSATDLLRLIDRFVSGEDTSLAAASEMEGIVIENFETEDWFDDVSVALAQYTPGGGEHMYDERALAVELGEARVALERMIAADDGTSRFP